MDFIRKYIILIVFIVVNVVLVTLIIMANHNHKQRAAIDGPRDAELDAEFDPEKHAGS